jgi:hypothetical protein
METITTPTPLSAAFAATRALARIGTGLTAAGAVVDAILQLRANAVAPRCASGSVRLMDFSGCIAPFFFVVGGMALTMMWGIRKSERSKAGVIAIAVLCAMLALVVFASMPEIWGAAHYDGPAVVQCWSF